MNLLIVRLSAIGDVIHTIPCLVVLKETFPDWRISWLVEETSAPLLEGHPCLDRLFVVKREWRRNKRSLKSMRSVASGFWELRNALRAQRFDVAVDFQGLLKSGLWTWLSGAPRRAGHRQTREFARFFLNEYVESGAALDPDQSVIKRNLKLAAFLGADISTARYVLPEATRETQQASGALAPEGDKPLLALCPFSAWPTKNWPIEYWRQLAGELAGEYQVLVVGSAGEAAAAQSVVAASSNGINLAGKTSLPVLADIFRRCRLVIGADTGPAHLATAVSGPKVLMLFGATPWKRTGPFGKEHAALSLDLDCQPCFERKCPLGHFNCMRQLTPENVLKAVRQ